MRLDVLFCLFSQRRIHVIDPSVWGGCDPREREGRGSRSRGRLVVGRLERVVRVDRRGSEVRPGQVGRTRAGVGLAPEEVLNADVISVDVVEGVLRAAEGEDAHINAARVEPTVVAAEVDASDHVQSTCDLVLGQRSDGGIVVADLVPALLLVGESLPEATEALLPVVRVDRDLEGVQSHTVGTGIVRVQARTRTADELVTRGARGVRSQLGVADGAEPVVVLQVVDRSDHGLGLVSLDPLLSRDAVGQLQVGSVALLGQQRVCLAVERDLQSLDDDRGGDHELQLVAAVVLLSSTQIDQTCPLEGHGLRDLGVLDLDDDLVGDSGLQGDTTSQSAERISAIALGKCVHGGHGCLVSVVVLQGRVGWFCALFCFWVGLSHGARPHHPNGHVTNCATTARGVFMGESVDVRENYPGDSLSSGEMV